MKTQKQTLLNYLRNPNPDVRGWNCVGGKKSRSKSNSRSKKNEWEKPTAFGIWKDFEYDTLTRIFNGDLYRVLQQEFDLQDFSTIPFFPFCWFFDENSLESLLIKWNQSVVTEALEKSQAALPNPDDCVHMVRGGQARLASSEARGRPDWACVQRPTSDITKKQKNLLPGDTKVSSKWSSKLIEPGKTDGSSMSIDHMRPLMQIYSYCLMNESRYGYIITDEELVVVRVRLDQASDSQRTFEGFGAMDTGQQESLVNRAREVGVLDCRAIPWKRDADASNGLTVNLALWWLHLLAAGDSTITDEKTYGALEDEYSAIWGSVMPDLQSLALSPSMSKPHRSGKNRAKSKANSLKYSMNRRASKDRVTKRGRSQGPRSAKNSFERR